MSSLSRRAEALSGLSRHVHPDDLDTFHASFHEVVTTPARAVVEDGVANDALWVVADGTFTIAAEIDGQSVPLGELGPGAAFGELSLLTGEPASATVRSTGSGRLLRLDLEDIHRLRASQPAIEAALLRALCEDLAERVREGRSALRSGEGELPDVRRGWLGGALARLFGRKT